MSGLPFELLLALRYLRPKRTFVSVITLISVLGVTLGVAVLIIVISVMSGFDRDLREKIVGFNPHLRLQKRDTTMKDYGSIISLVSSNPAVKIAVPFVLGRVMVETEPPAGQAQADAPYIRGIIPQLEPKVSILPNNIVAGNFDVSNRGVLVGTEFAANMHLRVGDRMLLYSPAQLKQMRENAGKEGAKVTAPEYEVRGVFDVGYYEYNSAFIVVSLEDAQDLYVLGESVHGLFVMLHDPYLAAQVQEQISQALPSAFSAEDLINLPELAARLDQAADPVSLYLKGQLSEGTRKALTSYLGSKSASGPLQTALLTDLNRLILSPSLFDAHRFASVRVRPQTEELLVRDHTGQAMIKLNRLLLEDAYPEDLSGYKISTWMEDNSQLLGAVAVEKNVMFVLLFFIMIVAALCILSAIITFVVQKTHEIGMLKALGATDLQVSGLFLSQSGFVGTVGVAAGFGLGMLLIAYRNEFLHVMRRLTGFELFPASIYGFSDLPALIIPGDILLICGSAFVICLLGGVIPAWRAGRLKPVEALRYE